MKLLPKIITIVFISFFMISCGNTKQTTNVKEKSTQKKTGNIAYTGGDGTSIENAIIILGAKNSFEGIPAEYAYVGKLYGKRSVDWLFISQSLVNKKGKSYDVLTIQKPPSKENIILYFDITDFFGKY